MAGAVPGAGFGIREIVLRQAEYHVSTPIHCSAEGYGRFLQ
jgi:hypothetical protein